MVLGILQQSDEAYFLDITTENQQSVRWLAAQHENYRHVLQ